MRSPDLVADSRLRLPGALAGLLLLLASCAEGAASQPASAEASSADGAAEVVTIVGTSFGVAEITVSAGDTVRWVNDSSLPHTVTHGQDGEGADDARFDEQINAGETVEITFDQAGDFDVTCRFHPMMNMVVHVT